jgi:hypothetical protein
MDSSRGDRVRARAQHLLAQLAPLPDESDMKRLRELSMDYIREAEKLEKENVTTREPTEQVSAVLDAIAREFFARMLQSKIKG